MDFRSFYLLAIFSLLVSPSRAEAVGSVFFIDSSGHEFIRNPSLLHVKPESMSLTDVGAAVSVLLGFAPPALSADSSSKLNEVLTPNPFHRPGAVFLLEVGGIDGSDVNVKYKSMLSSVYSSNLDFGLDKAEIQLPDEDKVVMVPLDEPLADYSDNEIGNFALWIGGSYAADSLQPLNGELTIPLAGGATMKLDMSMKADREFTVSLLSLIWNIRRAIEMHEDLSHGTQSPAELLSGSFDGIKILQEQYGPEGIAEQGEVVLLATLSRIFDTLQDAYKGQIVGVICTHGLESGRMLNVMFARQSAARLLAETKDPKDPKAAIVEVILVRKILAWITGIILIIATLLGIYFLLNMPLTRDTLLYSNVKLD